MPPAMIVIGRDGYDAAKARASIAVKSQQSRWPVGDSSTPDMIRIFLAEIARTGKVPANLKTDADDNIAGPWAQRAATLESFYGPTKTW